MLKFTVNYDDSQGVLTLNDYARRRLKVSLTSWRKLKRSGSLMINGHPAHPQDIVRHGDHLEFDLPEVTQLLPAAGSLTVCYEDESLLVVDKPAGLLVHPTSTCREVTLANIVLYYYNQKDEKIGFHPIHRLDRNTSGLLLIAKYPYIQQRLAQGDLKQVARRYLAIVHHNISQSGTISSPIGRKPGSIIERMVTPNGQQALTTFQVMKAYDTATLLAVTLETGRTHQIRAHLASIGHPLLGDDLYGGQQNLITRQALHSAELSFFHPLLQRQISVRSPLPHDMRQVLRNLSQG